MVSSAGTSGTGGATQDSCRRKRAAVAARPAPAMADTKMESSVHAWSVMPAGTGTRKRNARPKPTEAARGAGSAPWRQQA